MELNYKFNSMFYINNFFQNISSFSSQPWLVFWSNRSTGTAVGANSRSEALKKARKKRKKGYGDITGARQLTGKDAADARSGKWVRTRKSGLNPERGTKEQKLKARKDVTKYRKGLARISRESLKNKK
jgi:hypothetical protein